MDIHDPGQRRDLIALYKGVGHRVARRKTAGHGNEIARLELAIRLRLNQPKNVGDGHPLHRIVLMVTTRMERWLKIDSPHCRVLNGKVNDLPDLMLVHAPLDCRAQE